ncbi:MAG: histidinol-phosphatase [Alphaproteobacteria bacterium]|nr:histidinol-phosphatase [Alphaproteobacteria bacterium]
MAELDPRTIEFAHRLADRAGEVIRPFFDQPLEVEDKAKAGAFDPVTAADRGAEAALRTLIGAAYPDDAILGEEFGETRGTSGRRWVLDPLDGTRAFITGQLLWGTLIALEAGGERVLGLIDQPVLRERFFAAPGQALRIRPSGQRPLRVRACSSLAEAIVTTTHPFSTFEDDEARRFERVARAARMSRYGGDCYGYALLASGYTDLVIEAALRPWDVAALIPIIEQAGGLITDWHGRPLPLDGDYFAVVAAGDRRVHDEALKLLVS